MKHTLLIVLCGIISLSIGAQTFNLLSPDKSIEVKLNVDASAFQYSIIKNGEQIIAPSKIAMETNLFGLADFTSIAKTEKSEGVDNCNLYWGTTSKLVEKHTQLKLFFNNELSIDFRAYNDGVAWRFSTTYSDSVFVFSELTEFNLSNTSVVYFPEASGFSTPFEANYLPHKLSELSETKFGITPLLIKTEKGASIVISEVDLTQYPGMFVKMDKAGLKSAFPKYPIAEKEQFLGRNRLTNIPQLSKKMVTETSDYIATCQGTRDFPWRALLISENDKDLLANNLIAALAQKPSEPEDYNWVKPGKVVWDWYHNWDLQDVDFKPGLNTQTYLYMIDFAAKNNIEYVNIDDGWCGLHDFKQINKNLDLTKVLNYSKTNNVGVFLWCTWQTLEENLIEDLDYFASLGIAGLKVDFFDRCDQKVVDFVNLLAKESAKRNLLLNLHGMYKPTGLQVTYPNLVNFEGVLGLEYNKFSEQCTPTHNVTIPFARNTIGPMDYTPGAMQYLDSTEFKKSWKNPSAMTTKAQQMAMYIVYHGGIQMLADSPTLYKNDSIALNYLNHVPVTWDETIPIDAKIGEYVVVARRKGSQWYVAGINGSKEREITFNLNFLEPSNYKMEFLQDGNGPSELVKSSTTIKKDDSQTIKMKPAGGFILRITK